MNRFTNPHIGQPNIQQHMQQRPNMQQHMVQPMMQQQMQPDMQQQIVNLGNGMYAVHPSMVIPGSSYMPLDNGLVAVYPASIIRQQPMYSNMNPIMQQPMYPNTMINPAMQQHMQPLMQHNLINKTQEPPLTNSRFQSQQLQTPMQNNTQFQKEEFSQEKIMNFNIDLETEDTVKFPFTNFISKTLKHKYTSKDIIVHDNELTIVASMEEAIDSIIEKTYIENNSLVNKINIYKQSYILVNNIYGIKSNIIDDIKNLELPLVDIIKKYYYAVKSKNELLVALTLDEQFTELINNFLEINTPNKIKIDSFMFDIEELSGLLNSKSELVSVHNKMWYMLTKFREHYKFDLNTVKEAYGDEDNVSCTTLCDDIDLFYIDILNSEFNLNKVDKQFINVPVSSDSNKNSLSSVITSICEHEKTDPYKRNFIVTYEKSIFEIVRNLNFNYFIKKII